MFVSSNGAKCLRAHRAIGTGTVAYDGVPLAPAAASAHYFIGIRDARNAEKLTCSHALVMEMRSRLVAASDDANSALLAGKMSYGESRSELIDTFGSRKVRPESIILINLVFSPLTWFAQVKISRQKIKSSRVEGEDQAALNGIIDCRNDVAQAKHRPLNPHFSLPLFRYMLLQEFTSTEADGGPSPLAPACNPAASTVAKVYPVKQVKAAPLRRIASARLFHLFPPFSPFPAQLMPAGAWDVLPYRCSTSLLYCAERVKRLTFAA